MFEGDIMLKRIIPFAHSKIKEYLTENDIAVDMTAGNGNDTLFLAKLCRHVYSFDVQNDAIKNTRRLLEENNIDNVTLILDSHENIDNHITESIQCAVYNLGYLPSGDKSITTTASSTLKSLDKLLPLMKKNSLVSITVYVGHKEGSLESKQVEDYASKLPSNKFNVLLYSNLNKRNAPYNIFIEKIGD